MATSRRRHPGDEVEDFNPPGLGGPRQTADNKSPEKSPNSPKLFGELPSRVAAPPDEVFERLAEVESGLESFRADLLPYQQIIDQAGGQLRVLEQEHSQIRGAVEEHRQAMIAFGQRLDALARAQLQINTRATALQLAVQAKGSHEDSAIVAGRAEDFYRFLVRDLVLAQAEVRSEPAADPTSGTTH